jgi:hypothetical protein
VSLIRLRKGPAQPWYSITQLAIWRWRTASPRFTPNR